MIGNYRNMKTKYSGDEIIYSWIVSKVGNCSQGRPEGSLFNSYYTKV